MITPSAFFPSHCSCPSFKCSHCFYSTVTSRVILLPFFEAWPQAGVSPTFCFVFHVLCPVSKPSGIQEAPLSGMFGLPLLAHSGRSHWLSFQPWPRYCNNHKRWDFTFPFQFFPWSWKEPSGSEHAKPARVFWLPCSGNLMEVLIKVSMAESCVSKLCS